LDQLEIFGHEAFQNAVGSPQLFPHELH
jgi:hypothetical protein